MALHESLEAQGLTPTTGAAPCQDKLIELPRIGSLAEAAGLVLVCLLLLCWTVGAYAGVVYWSVQGSLWGVILSVIIPGFGATSTLPLYVWLGHGK